MYDFPGAPENRPSAELSSEAILVVPEVEGARVLGSFIEAGARRQKRLTG
jgi:hypothetical protein